MTEKFTRTAYPVQIFIFLAITSGCFILYLGATAVIMYLSAGGNIADLSSLLYNPRYIDIIKLIQSLSSVMIFMLPAFIFSLLADHRPAQYLGFTSRKISYIHIVLVLLIMVACLPFVGLTGQWNEAIHLPQFMNGLEKWMRDTDAEAGRQTKYLLMMKGSKELVLNLVMIALLPAISEELFFRGVMQRLLIKWSGKVNTGIIITAIIFSALHFQFLGFLPRMFLGIILGYIYALSGSIWLSMLAHFFNNGLQVVMLYLFQIKVIHYDVMKDQPTPLLAGIISLLLLIALFIVFRKFTERKRPGTLF
ncbi:MAG TPA: CPBP family intramembrane glutamic endopeptidase [Chitinophagaceae bacterium]